MLLWETLGSFVLFRDKKKTDFLKPIAIFIKIMTSRTIKYWASIWQNAANPSPLKLIDALLRVIAYFGVWNIVLFINSIYRNNKSSDFQCVVKWILHILFVSDGSFD